jgi:hypothetical protein
MGAAAVVPAAFAKAVSAEVIEPKADVPEGGQGEHLFGMLALPAFVVFACPIPANPKKSVLLDGTLR